jgi:general stress protein 26
MDHGDAIATLRRAVHGIPIAMLTTVADDGSLHSRPMAVIEAGEDGYLWFFTAASSPKVGELLADDRVSVTFCEGAGHRYVWVGGRGELVRDRGRARELWTPAQKGWFPQGPEDPELALLRVEVERAETWDASHGRMVRLAGFLKATLTGRPLRERGHRRLGIAGERREDPFRG